jgi:tetratricopeptide (TPR) repeat protein
MVTRSRLQLSMGFFTWLKSVRTRGRVLALLREGSGYYEAERHRDARTAWERALSLCIAARDHQEIGAVAGLVALAHYNLMEQRGAIRYGRIALRCSRSAGDTESMIRASAILGNAEEQRGELARALKRRRLNLSLALKLGDYESTVIAWGTLGQTLTHLGRYSEAVSAIQNALRLMEERKDAHGRNYLLALNMLGAAYRESGEHELADQTFERVRKQAVEEKSAMLESLALTNLSIGHMRQGRLEEAAAELRRCIDLKQSLEEWKGVIVSMNNLARCLMELGEYDEPFRILAESRATAERIEYGEGEAVANALYARTFLIREQPENALRHAERGLALAQEFCSAAHVGEMQLVLASVLIALGDHQAAATALAASTAAGESVRANMEEADSFRLSLFERHVTAYEVRQWVLAALGDNHGALEVAERGRARALSVALARESARVEAPPDLAGIRALAEELRTTFVVYSLLPDPVARVRGVFDPEIFAWVIPRDREHPIVFHRCGLSEIEMEDEDIALFRGLGARRSATEEALHSRERSSDRRSQASPPLRRARRTGCPCPAGGS